MEDTTTQHLGKYEQWEWPEEGSHPTTAKRKRKGLFLTLVALLIFALIGAGLGTWLWLIHQANSANTASLANQVVGHAVFISSGQLNENNSQGIDDELQINLQNITDPAPGKSYYAWLLSDNNKNPMGSLWLGRLIVNAGSIQFLYRGDQQHDNLIANYSRLLITEETIHSVSISPSSDRSTWRYYAELPQTTSSFGKHFRALDHLRNLLYQGSFIHLLGIDGSLNILLLTHVQKVWEWVSSARDSWGSQAAVALIYSLVVRSLDYLDGTPLIQKDVPPGTPLLVDKVLAQVPLVTNVKNTGVAGYVDRIDGELNRLISSPGITPEMHAIASKDYVALYKDVQTWLENVRQDAKRLVSMTDAQVLQPSTQFILDDMVTQANYALVGQLDPTTDEVQPGVVQIYDDIQRLATFNVMPYTLQK